MRKILILVLTSIIALSILLIVSLYFYKRPSQKITTSEPISPTAPDTPTNGICVSKCGDGVCDEVVCLGTGCPCAETLESCPQDCKLTQATMVTYEDNYVKFTHPENWNVEKLLDIENIQEEKDYYYILSLGIPDLNEEQYLTYTKIALKNFRPNKDLIDENTFEMGGKPGFKWVRQSSKSMILDHFTTAKDELGSIGFRVKIDENDKELEKQLDEVAKGLVVK